MNLELTDEQVALRDTVRRFLADKATIAGHVRPMLQDPTGTTQEVWQGLSQLGATGLLVPQEYGGAGMTMIEAGIVLEELGAALHPGPWLSTAVAAPRALTRLGAEAATLFTEIADGSTIATVGPVGGPRPTAIERSDSVVLRGEIDAVADAAAADVLLVLAERPGSTGLFAVETTTPDVVVTLERGIDQTRKQFRVTLDDAPAQRLAGASPDAVQALVDDVLVAHAADAADAQERHLAAVRAKAFAGRLATVGDTAIQVFGGIGYTWEHDDHLYLKRLLSWSAFLGGPDRYLREVGAQLAQSVRQRSCSSA